MAPLTPKHYQRPAPFSYLGVPAAAGMSDCYESMSRTPIRDRRITQPSVALGLVPSHRRGRRSAPFRHSREGENPRTLDPRRNASRDTNNHVRAKTRLARESDPAASSPPSHGPAPYRFNPLMRPSQCHWLIQRKKHALHPDKEPSSRVGGATNSPQIHPQQASPFSIPSSAGRNLCDRLKRKESRHFSFRPASIDSCGKSPEGV